MFLTRNKSVCEGRGLQVFRTDKQKKMVSNHTLVPLGYLINFCFQAKNNYLVAFSKYLT
jgi:hypothetical protein